MTSLPAFSYVASCALLDMLFVPQPLRRNGQRRDAIYRAAVMLPHPLDAANRRDLADGIRRALDVADPAGTLLCRDDGAGAFGDVSASAVCRALTDLARCWHDAPGTYRDYALAVRDDMAPAARRGLLAGIIGHPAASGSS